MKENIRALENMPANIKFKYSKILGCMTIIGGHTNQFKIGALYRIISKIGLDPRGRIDLMNLLSRKELNFHEVSKDLDLDRDLNDQEKNIFRFSLMKDLIIIMNADYVETEEERKLLEDIRNYFNISEEQFSFFQEEYYLDQSFFDNMENTSKLKDILKKTLATSAALGIPLAAICYSGRYKGLGILGTISGLSSLGIKRKTGKYSLAIGVATSILLGIAAYKTMKYILDLKKDEVTEIMNLTKENMEKLHRETKDTLHEDIQYFSNGINEDQDEADRIQGLVNILKAALSTLENTKAVLI